MAFSINFFIGGLANPKNGPKLYFIINFTPASTSKKCVLIFSENSKKKKLDHKFFWSSNVKLYNL